MEHEQLVECSNTMVAAHVLPPKIPVMEKQLLRFHPGKQGKVRMRFHFRKASRNWRIRNGRSWRSGRRYSGELLPVFLSFRTFDAIDPEMSWVNPEAWTRIRP